MHQGNSMRSKTSGKRFLIRPVIIPLFIGLLTCSSLYSTKVTASSAVVIPASWTGAWLIDSTHSPGVTFSSTAISTENQSWFVMLSALSILSFLNDPFSFLFVASDNGLPCFPQEPHLPLALTPQPLDLTKADSKTHRTTAEASAEKLLPLSLCQY